MTWAFEVSEEFEQDHRKSCRRSAGFRRAVDAKIEQILQNPMHFKPLRARMRGLRRVHVGGSYVLVLEPDESRSAVRFLRLAHHDEAYGIQCRTYRTGSTRARRGARDYLRLEKTGNRRVPRVTSNGRRGGNRPEKVHHRERRGGIVAVSHQATKDMVSGGGFEPPTPGSLQGGSIERPLYESRALPG